MAQRRLPDEAPVLFGFSYARILGSGGFADVFLYEQDRPRRHVAVKVVARSMVTPDVLRMFNSVPEILTIGVKMASALETAHRAGLLHRDIKPANILLTQFGAPVLSDFGIAMSIGANPANDVFALSLPHERNTRRRAEPAAAGNRR